MVAFVTWECRWPIACMSVSSESVLMSIDGADQSIYTIYIRVSPSTVTNPLVNGPTYI